MARTTDVPRMQEFKMKRKNNAIGLLPLFVVILSAFGTVRAAEEAVLWPGDSLTKVMRSDMPKADSEQPLQIEAARAEIASSQAIFRPHENVASATVTITDLRHSEADAIIPASAGPTPAASSSRPGRAWMRTGWARRS